MLPHLSNVTKGSRAKRAVSTGLGRRPNYCCKHLWCVVLWLVPRVLRLEMALVLGLGLELSVMAVTMPDSAVLIFVINPVLLRPIESIRV